MPNITVGTRVRTTADVENYPVIFMPAGATGRVTHIDEEYVCVDMDKHFEELNEWQNELQIYKPENGSFPVEAICTLKPCRFTFDGDRDFDGFAEETTWNGFDNVSVTPAVRNEIVAYFDGPDEAETNSDLMAMTPDENGLISLSYGFATQIVDPDS